MTRVFLEDWQIEGDHAVITGSEVHHLVHVLRLGVGDRFVAVDEGGAERSAEILQVAKGRVAARLGAPAAVDREPSAALTLYHGLPRARRFELALDMCTQLGVSTFVPVVCARSVVQIAPDRRQGKVERWQRIVREAARQCGRTRIPQVAELLCWDAALERFARMGEPGIMPAAALAGTDAVSLGDCLFHLICTESEPTALSLFIGPEGGFDLSEQEQARAAGIHLVTLGPRILRSETAAVAATAICMKELGAFD